MLFDVTLSNLATVIRCISNASMTALSQSKVRNLFFVSLLNLTAGTEHQICLVKDQVYAIAQAATVP